MNEKVGGAEGLLEALGAGGLRAASAYAERDWAKALAFVSAEEEHNPELSLEVTITGEPPISKRPRKSRDGRTVYAQDGGDRLSLGQLIQLQLPPQPPFEGQVTLDLEVHRAFPAGWPPYKRILGELGYLRPAVKPDYDNYAKIAADSMTGRLFRDDGQVVAGRTEKRYSAVPRLVVRFTGRRARAGGGRPPA